MTAEVEDIIALLRESSHIVHTRQTNGATDAADYEEPPHSWHPIDLIAANIDPPQPPTISGLVYPGRRHLFSGEPEALKSWAALVICAEQIREGNTTMYVDFEMGRAETLSRLHAIGLQDQQIQQQLIYIEPDEPFTDTIIRADVSLLLEDRRPTVVIMDAFTGALQTHALDPHKGVDIEAFYRTVVDPFRAHGAAVIILDHLAKDTATRGRFAIGSERKVGAAEVHLGFEVIVPFGRGRIGRAKITTHKDRPGHLQRPRAAELELTSHPTGLITWTIEPGEPADPDKPFRPTHLMEKVSRHLEAIHESATQNEIEAEVTGQAKAVRTAIQTLHREGFLTREQGPRNSFIYTLQTIYREAGDPTASTASDRVPTASETRSRTTASTASSPYKGGAEDVDEVDTPQPPTASTKNEDALTIPEDAGPPDPDRPTNHPADLWTP